MLKKLRLLKIVMMSMHDMANSMPELLQILLGPGSAQKNGDDLEQGKVSRELHENSITSVYPSDVNCDEEYLGVCNSTAQHGTFLEDDAQVGYKLMPLHL